MSIWPVSIAFHCSCALTRLEPGKTLISSPTLAAATSRAIICTISSRTSPLPPGNWCDAFSVTFCATAAAIGSRANSKPAACIRGRRVIGLSPSVCGV